MGQKNDDDSLVEERLITIILNGTAVRVPEGKTITAILDELGKTPYRRNRVSGGLRAPFCGMGVCFECEVYSADSGTRQRACLLFAEEGMKIKTVESVADEE